MPSLQSPAILLLEIARGRRPPDLFDVETSTPEQLSVDPAEEDRTTLELQRIAMRAQEGPGEVCYAF